MKFKILNTEKLVPHEEIDYQYSILLKKKILQEGAWTSPLMIDVDTLIIMDGHHRHEVARQLNLTYIPCFLISYSNVDVFYSKTNKVFAYKEIYDQVNSKQLFPCKTTRHVPKCIFPYMIISLEALKIFE